MSVKLRSSDNQLFEVSVATARQSALIAQMLDDSSVDEEIPLMNVKALILKKVIEYCEYHQTRPAEEIQKPLKSTNLMDCGVSDWDFDYISVEQEILMELIMAANYLDVKPLLELSCAKVASMIKGKTPEELRKTFNIVNDFTPEEEAQIREENKCFEDA
jgi:S-phase kinase-associated protein 1